MTANEITIDLDKTLVLVQIASDGQTRLVHDETPEGCARTILMLLDAMMSVRLTQMDSPTQMDD